MEALENLSYNSQIRQLRILAEAALTHYDIGKARLALLSHREDTLFKVTTSSRQGFSSVETADEVEGTRFVLRLYRQPGPSTESILSELEWLAALRRDAALVVPEPVAARNGSYITVIEVDGIPEVRHCVLTRWVEGRFVDTKLTPTLMERVGLFLARLHQHAEHFTPSAYFARPRWEWEDLSDNGTWNELLDRRFVAKQYREIIPKQAHSLFAATVEKISERVEHLPQDSHHYGLIHGDFWQTNYLFHRGEVRAIDFEDCSWNYYLFDLATALRGIENRPGELAMRAALISGYEQMRPLPAHYETQLQAFAAASILERVNYLLHSRDTHIRSEISTYIEYAVNRLREFISSRIKNGV
ncbi:MAG TPA: phosphotransferase [Ktedonobacteraceae bacterium]|nr:phosphotransferase [Ktedonobacteraceae bacterium]